MNAPGRSTIAAPLQAASAGGVSVHVERLVLNALPLGRDAGPRVEAAFTRELTRLLGEAALRGELRDEWRDGAALSYLRLHPITLDTAVHPARVGRQLAQALARDLMPPLGEDGRRHE